jgi:RNase P subunit RPR2
MSFYDIVKVLYLQYNINKEYNMSNNQETITIICDNEDCRTEYILSLDILKAADYVDIVCKNCGDIQRIILNNTGGIELQHIK